MFRERRVGCRESKVGLGGLGVGYIICLLIGVVPKSQSSNL